MRPHQRQQHTHNNSPVGIRAFHNHLQSNPTLQPTRSSSWLNHISSKQRAPSGASLATRFASHDTLYSHGSNSSSSAIHSSLPSRQLNHSGILRHRQLQRPHSILTGQDRSRHASYTHRIHQDTATIMRSLFSTCTTCASHGHQASSRDPKKSDDELNYSKYIINDTNDATSNNATKMTGDDSIACGSRKCSGGSGSQGSGRPADARCWSCPDALPNISALFCGHCGVLQPPVVQDHYALFDIPKTFDVDTQQLEVKFHKLLQKVHPDLFNSKSPQEQSFSLAHASEINSSYEVLKDPLARARYLLSLTHPELLDERYQTVDTMTLMKIMDRREIIEDSSDPQELIGVFRENVHDQSVSVEAISKSFKTNDMEEVSRQCQLLSYYYSMHKDLLTRLPSGVVNSSCGQLDPTTTQQEI